MNHTSNRRPLKVRQVPIAQKIAQWLTARNITPNQISIFSIICAMLAAIGFIGLRIYTDTAWYLPLFAALFIQCRLLCNLFDGMVAVEGGKTTESGELFNDIPDRISDPLILISAGYAVYHSGISVELGWLAGLLSVMTAYIRTLSSSIGAPVDFSGPMAKQQRMAVLTLGCILASIELYFLASCFSLVASLLIICIGNIVTIVNRTKSAYQYLEGK